MRATRSAIVVVGLLATSPGCAALRETSRPTTADCTLQLRIDDDVYTQRGRVEQRGKSLGLADASDCSDVGPDSRGFYFTEDPRQIRVWSVPGFEYSEVVVTNAPERQLVVYVADSVTEVRGEEIDSKLTGEPRRVGRTDESSS